MDSILTIIGLIGVAMSITCYALLTRRIFTNSDPRYYAFNILGTVLICISLIAQWNLAAFVSQILWITISTVGLVRAMRGRA